MKQKLLEMVVFWVGIKDTHVIASLVDVLEEGKKTR